MDEALRGNPQYDPAVRIAAGVQEVDVCNPNFNMDLGPQNVGRQQVMPLQQQVNVIHQNGRGQQGLPLQQQQAGEVNAQQQGQQEQQQGEQQEQQPAQLELAVPAVAPNRTRTLRRAAVDAFRGLEGTMGQVRDEIRESNVIQRQRNDILMRMLNQ